MDNNLNLNDDMLNNLKNMMGDKDMNDVLSQISPEMIDNFSKMMGNKNSNGNSNSNTSNSSSNNNSANNLGNIDFSNLDMNTILKFQSIFQKLNTNKDDPRSNLLYSLKPYLRDERKENIDKYANMLKLANIADLGQLFNNNEKKENPKND